MFQPAAIATVYERTGGIPRLVNQLCEFALVYAFAEARKDIDADLISQIVRDRDGARLMSSAAIESNIAPLSLADRGVS